MKQKDGNERMTLAEAALLYYEHRQKMGIGHPAIAPATLRIHCANGKLKAEKFAKTWTVTRRDVEQFAELNPGPGTGGTPRQGQPGAKAREEPNPKRKQGNRKALLAKIKKAKAKAKRKRAKGKKRKEV